MVLPNRILILLVLVLLGWHASAVRAEPATSQPDVFTEDATRFLQVLTSHEPERRIEGLQGLSNLRYWPAEAAVIEQLSDSSHRVRLEAVLALGRLGSAQSIPFLIGCLVDPSWEIRQNAWLGLQRMTAQSFPVKPSTRWKQWWEGGAAKNHESALLAAITNAQSAIPRTDALRALPHFATPSSEDALLGLLAAPSLTVEERNLVADALDRVGTARSVSALARFHTDHAAWALGRIGGPAAEQALLKFPKTLDVLLNLDRLHSTNSGGLISHLVANMGLITYRGQPDDLMLPEAQPIQRVGANLIRRSGQAPEFINQVLLELEYTMTPPPAAPRPPPPEPWKAMLEAMRPELKPGFVRGDGVTTSQPLTAMYHVATDRALAGRLIPLLHHPAFVPRIYVAMTLGKLHATEAVPEMVSILREGYAFSDSVALASGKHFEQSQTVRWRGFFSMALGRMGGEDARLALEQFATDAQQPRDIRYSSVVGLGFIASPQSLPALRKVATHDIIWMVQDEARRAAADIELLAKEARP